MPFIKPLRRSWVIASRVGLGAIARREGLAATIVEKIGAVAKAALVAKGVPSGDPGAAVRVDPGMRGGTIAVRGAADGLLKASPKSN